MTSFDGDTTHALGQNLLLVADGLRIETRRAWHRYHPHMTTLRFEQLLRLQCEHDFGARGNQQRFGCAFAIREHIAALGNRHRVNRTGDLRQVLAREHQR